mmetsp:Transcript_12938/g.21137  ORF Transcript_12938/g.21137 Transcript_12938/m.21137 type:complete len:181 (+) Transcript_12938:1823-2365(+)
MYYDLLRPGTDVTGDDSKRLLPLLLCSVTSLMECHSIRECEENIGGLADLIVSKQTSVKLTSSDDLSIKQPCLPLSDVDCLKCLSSMLLPLMSKLILDTKTIRLLLLRLDEASALHPSVAQSPLVANLLHAMVTANKNSGHRLLKDCLEELQSILMRAPKSVVARNALAEVNKLQDKIKH